MPGFVSCTGPCIGCGEIFTYNPVRVPSVVVNGVREPACLSCVEKANPERRARGLAEIVVLPDAYEACEEAELL